jgi:hypothetical protein
MISATDNRNEFDLFVFMLRKDYLSTLDEKYSCERLSLATDVFIYCIRLFPKGVQNRLACLILQLPKFSKKMSENELSLLLSLKILCFTEYFEIFKLFEDC